MKKHVTDTQINVRNDKWHIRNTAVVYATLSATGDMKYPYKSLRCTLQPFGLSNRVFVQHKEAAISRLSAKNPRGSMRCPRGFYAFPLKSMHNRKLIFLPLTQLEMCANSEESKICVLFFGCNLL